MNNFPIATIDGENIERNQSALWKKVKMSIKLILR